MARLMCPLVILTLIFSLVPVSWGWHLVMAIPKGATDLGGARSVYDLWASNLTLNEGLTNPLTVQPGVAYKSPDVVHWDNRSISLVKVAFYKAGKEMAHVVFSTERSLKNGSDSLTQTANQTSWFDCTKIVYSTWDDFNMTAPPEVCTIHDSESLVEQSFAIMASSLVDQADCENMTGWFTLMEPASENAVISCDWQHVGSPPYFLYQQGNSSEYMSKAELANLFAVFVDDCIDEVLCRQGECHQDALGECYCHGYKCTEACSFRPCGDEKVCVTDAKNESSYECVDPPDLVEDSHAISAGTITGICVGITLLIVGVGLGVWCFFRWRNKQDELTHRAAVAKDFVRRGVNRLSGRNHQPPRRHLREEKSSPRMNNKSEQLSPDSSSVFGSANPAFIRDDPNDPPTPPVDKRYTEFPTRQGAQVLQPPSVSVSHTEIQLREKKVDNLHPNNPVNNSSVNPKLQNQRHYENVSGHIHPSGEYRRGDTLHHPDFDRASTIGSFEKASTMSEMSDATSTSGYSDYTGDTPANLPPSEMISKDVLRHGHHYRHRPRSRPKSRTSTIDPPRTLAPQTMENQINYAMERSRRSISSMSSLSSDATHRSDGTQRSGEQTKSDALRARYEHNGDPAGRFPRSDLKDATYQDIKKQLEADMNRREARERKREIEIERDVKYEAERAKHRMRQVESLDSGIDAENATADRHSDGRLEIIRSRSADQLDHDTEVRYNAREATV